MAVTTGKVTALQDREGKLSAMLALAEQRRRVETTLAFF
jgi:hypothetical protein